MNTKPNVLFLFTDDQRFDTIGALGNDRIQTPNIDQLVSRGVSFTNAHIPGGTCGAVCMPSRAMLHTGRSLFHLEGSGQSIPDEHTMMGETFADAGYDTFGTGKWHNGPAAFNRSFANGDEIFFGGMTDHWNVPAFHYDPTGRYDSRTPICPEPMKSNHVVYRNCDHMAPGTHSSTLLADSAISYIEQTDTKKPFLAYVAFLAPHDPRTMPSQFLEMYNPDDVELPPNFAPGHAFDNGELHVRDELLAGFPRTAKETKRHIAEYYAMITHLDYEIGRIIEALAQRDILENTIIVLAGDNGLAVGQHGLFGKQSCYDHSIRVPLMLSGPGIEKATQRDEAVYLFDIYPSLCEVLGMDIPESVDGKSFASLLTDANSTYTEREALYFAYTGIHRAVVENGYKLIEYAVDGEHAVTQLFNLEADPWEMNNLAESKEHAERVSAMRARLLELKDSWDDEATSWGRNFYNCLRNDQRSPYAT